MHAPPPDEPRDHKPALWLLSGLALTLCAATALGGFRADDWINLERGRWAWTAAGAHDIWTSLNPFTLYRPLVDLWHGLMLRLFGLNTPPMLLVLSALLLAQSLLLGRLVREHGGSRNAAMLATVAVWCQPNAYAWTALWVSNATGSLMATFSLAALLLFARAARHGARGRNMLPSLVAMTLTFLAGALCKEEIVLLPGAVFALEWLRWPQRDARERRARIIAWVTLVAVTGAYTIFRTHILPTPQMGENRYHLRLGMHVFHNIGFFLQHLGAMPLVTLVLARFWVPAAFRSQTRSGGAWTLARTGMLSGAGWAVAASLLYLPISGRPAYGYLYIPAFGVAYALAFALDFASQAAAAAGSRRTVVAPLAVHAVLASALCAAGLIGIAWHRYPQLAADAEARLLSEHPSPPRGARMVFLDCGTPARETFAGRTIFNLVFDDASGSFLRLVYDRDDLDAVIVHGAVPETYTPPPGTIAIYRAQMGELTPWTPTSR
jgi:hypothetical protein